MYSTVSMLEAEEWYRTEVASERDPTFGQATQTSSELKDFLRRPVKVFRTDWTKGSDIDVDIKPWQLFFSDSRVQDKIRNFHLLTCNLVVRIQINASPFQYGRLLVSYNPWATINGVASDNIELTTGNTGQFLVCRSQRPHVWIEASTNQSGELKLPFHHPDNALVLQDIGDFSDMGTISINSLRPLAAAKPDMATHPVSITVWVHAEDITLSVPTSAQIFVPQADEYDTKGVISKPADTVAGVAGLLASVPVIGPFARATEIAAGAVASIARLFGFSRPVIADDPMFVRPRNVGSVANVNSKEVCEKLTLDAKQELTVDPRTTGLSGADEMSIAHIAQRESLFSIFKWKMEDAHETCLYGTCVMPRLEAEQASGGGSVNHPTAVSFATRPFSYWSGSLKFRFNFICSRFHRGRVRIVYDPYAANVMLDPDSYNVAFQKVIDLAGGRDVTIEIPWMQAEPYKSTRVSSAAAGQLVYRPTWQQPDIRPDVTFVGQCDNQRPNSNGFLAVYVLNELCDAGSNEPIYCAVSVSAGKDFELGNPTRLNFENDFSFQVPEPVRQVFEAQMDCEEVGEQDAHNMGENAPTHEDMPADSIADTVVPMIDMKQKIFMGEVITSFRSLLRRYALVYVHAGETDPSDLHVRTINCAPMPVWPGNDPAARETAQKSLKTNLFTYLVRAYVSYRGGTRRKLYYSLKGKEGNNATWAVSRTNNSPDYLSISTGLGTNQALWEANSPRFWEGAALTATRTNASLEYEIPYYRNKRFSFARWSNVNEGTSRDGSNESSHLIQWYAGANVGEGGYVVNELFAIGEDFNFFFFLNAPCYWSA